MRMIKVSDTLHRISVGRDTIGWCRRWASGWKAEAAGKMGEGDTASAAFYDLARKRGDAQAQRHGFASQREMINAHNAKVREDVALWNAIVDDFVRSPLNLGKDVSWILKARVRRRRVRR